MNFIDLFAGAGGLSEGFKKAGFNPIAHVELDNAACFTLKTRVAYHYLKNSNRLEEYYAYLKGEISRNELHKKIPEHLSATVINAAIGTSNKKTFKQIDKLKGDKTVDFIVGGPPCQAYSYIGRAALKHKPEDPRKKLYIYYGHFLKKYSPNFFVFENVPGLKSSDDGKHYKNLVKYFKSIGYKIDDRLLNSYDFGVIQNRKRLIIIGWKEDIDFTYPEFEPLVHSWTRDDIFSDLPAIKHNHTERLSYYTTTEPNDYLRFSEIRNGVDFLSLHNTRPHNAEDLNIYRLAIKKLSNEGKRLKNDEIPLEERTQKNTTDFLDRFKVVDALPHTMIAHIAKDGHHFIHHDLEQLRSISIREAARIQSFPDDFYFEGVKENQNRTSAFKQIGNAVPPLMAFNIATKIFNLLHV
ncbi:MAG: DNA (cytosine-5-)-methyltransferase [Ferruginibacter sp.]